MAALATIADIEDRGRRVTDLDEQSRLDHLLRLGSALLRLRFVTIDARAADATFAELVADVLVAMVLRAPSIANPGGVRSESVSDDTYSVTYEGVSSGSGFELTLTDAEAALLSIPTAEPVPLFGSARLRAVLS